MQNSGTLQKVEGDKAITQKNRRTVATALEGFSGLDMFSLSKKETDPVVSIYDLRKAKKLEGKIIKMDIDHISRNIRRLYS